MGAATAPDSLRHKVDMPHVDVDSPAPLSFKIVMQKYSFIAAVAVLSLMNAFVSFLLYIPILF